MHLLHHQVCIFSILWFSLHIFGENNKIVFAIFWVGMVQMWRVDFLGILREKGVETHNNKNQHIFSCFPGLGGYSSTNKHWIGHKRLLAPFFNAGFAKSFFPYIDRVSMNLVNLWKSKWVFPNQFLTCRKQKFWLCVQIFSK